MQYNLVEVFDQAVSDNYLGAISGDGYLSIILYGIKIIKDESTSEVQILATNNTGEHYINIDDDDLNVFLEKGWKYGTYQLSLSNYRLKLDWIESRIKKAINSGMKESSKKFYELKSDRDNILDSYQRVTIKFNKLKSEQNDNI